MSGHDYKLNWLTVFSTLLGVLGIISSYYFYIQTIKERVPILMEEPLRSIIVEGDTLNKSPLKVVNADGTTVTKDISSLRFYFWNNGKESIKKSNILSPIYVLLDSSGIEIINFKVLRTSRLEVIKPKLELVSANKLNISFDILEYNDGFFVQILFAGANDAKLKVNGVIEGVESIQSNDDIRPQFENENIIGMIIIGIFCIALFLFPIAERNRRMIKVEERLFPWQFIKNKDKTHHVFMIIVFITIISACTFLIFNLALD